MAEYLWEVAWELDGGDRWTVQVRANLASTAIARSEEYINPAIEHRLRSIKVLDFNEGIVEGV